MYCVQHLSMGSSANLAGSRESNVTFDGRHACWDERLLFNLRNLKLISIPCQLIQSIRLKSECITSTTSPKWSSFLCSHTSLSSVHIQNVFTVFTCENKWRTFNALRTNPIKWNNNNEKAATFDCWANTWISQSASVFGHVALTLVNCKHKTATLHCNNIYASWRQES